MENTLALLCCQSLANSRNNWRESPAADMQRGFRLSRPLQEISLVRVVELIMTEAAAARESRAIGAERVVTALRRDVALREHRASGERQQRQSSDKSFHLDLHRLRETSSGMISLAPGNNGLFAERRIRQNQIAEFKFMNLSLGTQSPAVSLGVVRQFLERRAATTSASATSPAQALLHARRRRLFVRQGGFCGLGGRFSGRHLGAIHASGKWLASPVRCLARGFRPVPNLAATS
jgi:hypothetical protein